MTGSFSVRVFAAAQLAFETGLYVAGAARRWAYGRRKAHPVTDADGTVMGEMMVGQGFTRDDLAHAAEHLFECIRRGHADRRMFHGVSMRDDIDFRNPTVLYDDGKLFAAVLRHAKDALDLGALRSGLLPSFVTSQLGHLLECRECAEAAVSEVRTSVQDGEFLSAALGKIGFSPRAQNDVTDIDPHSIN